MTRQSPNQLCTKQLPYWHLNDHSAEASNRLPIWPFPPSSAPSSNYITLFSYTPMKELERGHTLEAEIASPLTATSLAHEEVRQPIRGPLIEGLKKTKSEDFKAEYAPDY